MMTSHQPHHQPLALGDDDDHNDWSSSSDCLAMMEQRLPTRGKKTPDFHASSSFHSSFTSFHASAVFDEAFTELQSEITHLFDDEVPDTKTEQDANKGNPLDLADLTSHTVVMSDSYTTDEDDEEDDVHKSASSDVEYYSDSDDDDDFTVPDKVLEEIQMEMLMVDMANQQPPPPDVGAAGVGAQGGQEDRIAAKIARETKSKSASATLPPPPPVSKPPNTSTSSPPPSVANRAPKRDSTSTIPTTAMRQSRHRDLLNSSSHSRSAHGYKDGPLSTATRPTTNSTTVSSNAYRRNRRTTPYSSSSTCSREAVEPRRYSDYTGIRGTSASVTSSTSSRRNAASNNSYHRHQEGSSAASATSNRRYQSRMNPNVRRSTTSASGYRPSPAMMANTTTTTQPRQPAPLRQGHYQRPQRPVETAPTMIEIAPGVSARLRGASETWQAIERDEFLVGVACWGCDQNDLCCVSGATHVLCPTCRVMSPLPGLEDAAGHNNRTEPCVGLGFTYEELRKWQSEILRGRRVQASRRY